MTEEKKKKPKKQVFNNERAIWKGEPISFPRNRGTSYGFMIGSHMYTYTADGALESCVPLVWQEMQQVVEATFKNVGPAMGAYARLLKMEKRNEAKRDKGDTVAADDTTGNKPKGDKVSGK